MTTLNLTGSYSADGSDRMTADYLYNNISTATTTLVKAGSGILHGIVIDTAGVLGTVTVYDNTSASGPTIASIGASTVGDLIYDVDFNTGLTIVTSSGANLTVTYK